MEAAASPSGSRSLFTRTSESKIKEVSHCEYASVANRGSNVVGIDSIGITIVLSGVLDCLAQLIKEPTMNTIKINRTFGFFLTIIFLVSIFYSFHIYASQITPKTISLEIKKILSNSTLKNTDIGIKIVSVKNGEVLFEKNSGKLLIPASNAKILTAAASLIELGPKYKFITKALTDGSTNGNLINGNLYIKGNGDTFFVTEMIYYFANELAIRGYTEIKGDVIIDDFYFDREYDVPPGDRAYVAPVSAVAANFNSISVFVQPGTSAGSPTIAFLDPPNVFVKLVNQAKTGGSKSTISVIRKSDADNNIIVVSGSIPVGHKGERAYRSISNPPLYAGSVIKSIFGQRGIKIAGVIQHKETPLGVKEILEYKSKSFDLVVKDLMNFSNNMIANQLIKVLGAHKYGEPGSMEKGLRAAKESLASMGIQPDSFVMVDGSGYDRQNRVSANLLTHILKKMSEDLALFPSFWFSLPVAGEEGTLERRFKNNYAKGKIRAKSGTITGVATLAGYAPSKDDELFAFSILINDPRGRTRELYSYQEKIGELLCNFTRQQ